MRNLGKTSVTKGAILTVSMRWADRAIGFVSTLILARLLAPEDFGIIAMASLVVGLVDAFLALGVHVALIQNHNAEPAHYNTAWTLRLAQLGIAAALIFLAAPHAAIYFNDPRIVPVLRFMAVGMLLMGVENIGIVTFQKEMRFGLDFRFAFLKRIASFLITIVAAWFMHSYWALVIGNLAGRSIGVFLSYRMHPMRPRFSLEKVKEIFSVSQWMLMSSIAAYLNRSLDNMLVGRHENATVVGGYTLANEISAMPTTEVLAPLNRVLFPAFVEAKQNLSELKRLYLLAQGVQSLIGMAAGVGLALVADEAVAVLLGEKWKFVVPFVQVLTLAYVMESIATSGGYVLITMGKVRSAAFVSLLQIAFFAVAVFLVLKHIDAFQLALLRVVAVFSGLIVSFWLLRRALNNLSLMDIIRTLLRPVLATGVMALAVITIGDVIHAGPLVELAAKIVTGVLSYPAAILLMWYVVGRPDGAESYLLTKVCSSLPNVKRK
jgi:O-antigen/teichoic acid export membrane protein